MSSSGPSPNLSHPMGEGGSKLSHSGLRFRLNSEICDRLAGGCRKTNASLPITPAFIEDFEDHHINTLFQGNIAGHVGILFESAWFGGFQQELSVEIYFSLVIASHFEL